MKMTIKYKITPELLSIKNHLGLPKVFLKEVPFLTPKGNEVIIPNDVFLKCINGELRKYRRVKNQSSSTLNKLIMYLDSDKKLQRELVDEFLKYLTTDLLFYRVSSPERLSLLQNKSWDDAINHYNKKLGTSWRTTENVTFISQPNQSILKTSKFLEKLSILDLIIMHSILKLSGSCVIAILCKFEKIDYRQAWELCFLEELWYHRNIIKDDQSYLELTSKRSDLMINMQLLSSLC